MSILSAEVCSGEEGACWRDLTADDGLSGAHTPPSPEAHCLSQLTDSKNTVHLLLTTDPGWILQVLTTQQASHGDPKRTPYIKETVTRPFGISPFRPDIAWTASAGKGSSVCCCHQGERTESISDTVSGVSLSGRLVACVPFLSPCPHGDFTASQCFRWCLISFLGEGTSQGQTWVETIATWEGKRLRKEIG